MTQISIYAGFIEYFSTAAIIVDCKGEIKTLNRAAELLFKKKYSELKSIYQIDPRFDPDSSGIQQHKRIEFENISLSVNIIEILYNQKDKGFLYLFEQSSALMDMDLASILDYIDDAIFIMSKDGTVEECNKTTYAWAGFTTNLKGKNIEEIMKMGIIEESTSFKVLSSHKIEYMNIKYNTGKTVLYTAKPVFNENGEFLRVITTGRDISSLISMENKLNKTEQLKSKYSKQIKELRTLLGMDQIIYSSDAINKIIKLAIKVSKSDSPIFIWGESGVGKELIARLIHDLSNRKDMPFIAVNCAAIPSELLESELFGYDEGAFTGAKRGGKKGLFEEANGGTIFLDEIGEMPLNMQSKLLRVLQTNEVMRVGGNKAISIDARIVSSTNLSKTLLVDEMKFRQDLYYRLSVVPIYVPPLKDRRDDILPLINFFLKNFNSKYNKDVRLTKPMSLRLQSYDWPGNVRELKNVVERIVLLAETNENVEDDFDIVSQFGIADNDHLKNGTSLHNIKTLRSAEDFLIKDAYKKYGSVIKAAESLKISPSTIYRKIKKGLNLD